MSMASPEACFQAPTADDCIDQIYRWMPSTSPFRTLLLRDAIENLCMDIMTPESQQQYSQLGPLNLFAMVSGELDTITQFLFAECADELIF